jgi:hypothetical protein
MKNILLLLGWILLVSFVGERYFHFTLSESKATYHWQNLENIKLTLDQSTLPHNQVKLIVGAIDSLQKDLQTSLQVDSVALLKK